MPKQNITERFLILLILRHDDISDSSRPSFDEFDFEFEISERGLDAIVDRRMLLARRVEQRLYVHFDELRLELSGSAHDITNGVRAGALKG